jgi:hypothetical protein
LVVKKSVLIFAAFILALAGACFAQSDQPQSLADLARKNKPKKKAVLVLSDEDLPPPSAPPSGDDGVSAASADSGPSSDADKKEVTAKDAGKDSDKAHPADQRTSELKQKLARYQKEEDVWKQSAKHYEELIANEPSDFRRQMYEDSLNNDKHNAALYQQKVDEIQNELSKPQQKSDSAHSDNSAQSGGSQP